MIRDAILAAVDAFEKKSPIKGGIASIVLTEDAYQSIFNDMSAIFVFKEDLHKTKGFTLNTPTGSVYIELFEKQ